MITKELIEDAKALLKNPDGLRLVKEQYENSPALKGAIAAYINGLEHELAWLLQRQSERQAVAVPDGMAEELRTIAEILEADGDEWNCANRIRAILSAATPADTVKQDDYEAMKRDAERYRWLRDQSRDPDGDKPYCVTTKEVLEHGKPARMVSYLKFDEALDKAIDAAIQEKKQ